MVDLHPIGIPEDVEHSSPGKYQCPHPGCGKQLTRASGLQVRDSPCHDTCLTRAINREFQVHLNTHKTHQGTSSSLFTCKHPGCNRRFGTQANRDQHYERIHGKKASATPSQRRIIAADSGKETQGGEDTRFFHKMARDAAPPPYGPSRGPS